MGGAVIQFALWLGPWLLWHALNEPVLITLLIFSVVIAGLVTAHP